MNRAKYIQSIQAQELTWEAWEQMRRDNLKRINRLRRIQRVILWFISIVSFAFATGLLIHLI